jgi:hypothetical protein
MRHWLQHHIDLAGMFLDKYTQPKFPSSFLQDCLSQGFYSCTNIMTKHQVGEERVYLAYTSILLFITKEVRTGTQAGQEAGADAETMEECSLLACSACSLIEPKTTSPQMVPPTRGLSRLITNLGNASMRYNYKAFSQLVINGERPLVGGTISGLVVLGSIGEQAEQARGSKPVSNIPPWPLHQLLLPDLLEFQS